MKIFITQIPLPRFVISFSVEAVQQLERKQQKPPHSSIPGRAREEQMPPKQMFKVWRSANDQVRVMFQVTDAPAGEDHVLARFPCQVRSLQARFVLAEGAIHGQQLRSADKKVKMGRRKGQNLELRRSTKVPSWYRRHAAFL